MPFFVTHKTLQGLACRSKQTLCDYRTNKIIPFKKTKEGDFVSDVDSKKVRDLVVKPPPNATNVAKDRWKKAVAKFQEDRISGEVVCALTGEPDVMAAFEDPEDSLTAMLPHLEDDALDRKKKELEVEKLGKTIEKMEVAMKALTGDLIDRTYVETWVGRYVGNLHTQVLELPSTGVGGDVFNLVMRNKDNSQQAIKEVEAMLERRLSQILKDSRETMRRNAL